MAAPATNSSSVKSRGASRGAFFLRLALFFFGGNPTTAIIATVIYAVPPIIRTTALGLQQVPVELNEVALRPREFDEALIEDGSKLEIIRVAAGG